MKIILIDQFNLNIFIICEETYRKISIYCNLISTVYYYLPYIWHLIIKYITFYHHLMDISISIENYDFS